MKNGLLWRRYRPLRVNVDDGVWDSHQLGSPTALSPSAAGDGSWTSGNLQDPTTSEETLLLEVYED